MYRWNTGNCNAAILCLGQPLEVVAGIVQRLYPPEILGHLKSVTDIRLLRRSTQMLFVAWGNRWMQLCRRARDIVLHFRILCPHWLPEITVSDERNSACSESFVSRRFCGCLLLVVKRQSRGHCRNLVVCKLGRCLRPRDVRVNSVPQIRKLEL